MIIKNLKKYFTFEVQVNKTRISCKEIWAKIVRNLLVWEVCVTSSQVLHLLTLQVLDDKNVKRRFRASNYQSTTRVKPFICTMPMRLDDGWNQIQVNYTRIFAWKPLLACDKLIERTSCQIKQILIEVWLFWCTSLKTYIGFDLFGKYSFLWRFCFFNEKRNRNYVANIIDCFRILIFSSQFNLSDFTRRAYGTNYIETLRVQVRLEPSFFQFGVLLNTRGLQPFEEIEFPVRSADCIYYINDFTMTTLVSPVLCALRHP